MKMEECKWEYAHIILQQTSIQGQQIVKSKKDECKQIDNSQNLF